MKKNSLFANEEKILEKAKIILEENIDKNIIVKTDYNLLFKSYKKMFKQLKLLVKMGDIQQNKLNKLNEKLDINNKFIKKTFGKYLSDDIVKCILDSPEGTSLGGEKRVVSILITDIRGFTAITEQESADKIVGMLNIYLEIMTEIIFKYGGTIDEFIGDSILVIFGAPIKSTNHADKAVECAIEMQNAMIRVNNENKKLNFPEIEMGIGINTGELIVGNIGSDKRAKYAVVGSNVNLTSRIESYTVGGQIFISEKTLNSCQDRLIIKASFEAKPKGMEKPIKIFEVKEIAGKQKLSIDETKNKFVTLQETILINFSFFDGKHGTDNIFYGEIYKISKKEISITTNIKIDIFSNLKISIIDKNIKENLYGKVILQHDTKNPKVYKYNIHFTSIPKEYEDLIKKYE